MTELNQLLQRLCDAEIDFVIVGGVVEKKHAPVRQARLVHLYISMNHEFL